MTSPIRCWQTNLKNTSFTRFSRWWLVLHPICTPIILTIIVFPFIFTGCYSMNSTFISAVSGSFWLSSFVTLSVTFFVTLVTVLIFWGFIVQYPFSCLRRFELDEKRALHSSHSYGFSPVWTRSWLFRSVFKMNFFGQKLHWNGFSPVCLNIESSRYDSEQFNKIENEMIWVSYIQECDTVQRWYKSVALLTI